MNLKNKTYVFLDLTMSLDFTDLGFLVHHDFKSMYKVAELNYSLEHSTKLNNLNYARLTTMISMFILIAFVGLPNMLSLILLVT